MRNGSEHGRSRSRRARQAAFDRSTDRADSRTTAALQSEALPVASLVGARLAVHRDHDGSLVVEAVPLSPPLHAAAVSVASYATAFRRGLRARAEVFRALLRVAFFAPCRAPD